MGRVDSRQARRARPAHVCGLCGMLRGSAQPAPGELPAGRMCPAGNAVSNLPEVDQMPPSTTAPPPPSPLGTCLVCPAEDSGQPDGLLPEGGRLQ